MRLLFGCILPQNLIIEIINNQQQQINIITYLKNLLFSDATTVRKMSKYRVFSGLYFSAFGLNTEIYSVNLHIQSEYGKIQTRKSSVFGQFSRSA